MSRKVTVLGTGYVGLTLGVCLASFDNFVFCVDKDGEKIQKLKEGISPIFESGLAELLEKNKEKLYFTLNLEEALKESEIVFIAVGTPFLEDGGVDMTYFKEAVEEIASLIDNYKVIVDKSTVPVGTGDWVKEQIKRIYSGDFSIVSNPEFLREGNAVNDFLNPDRIIIGVKDEKAKDLILDLYSSISAPKIITSVRSAELIKYASNAFLATKISFINEIANFCERAGANIDEVAEGIGADKRIGKQFLKAGIGYGGSCLPKDTKAFYQIIHSNGYDFKLLKSVIEVNESQRERILNKIKTSFSDDFENKTVSVLGMAFKKNTDDVRESPAIEITKKLLELGSKIRVYDPRAEEKAKEVLGERVKFCDSPYESLENADLVLITTEWEEFTNLDWGRIKNLLKRPVIIDGRNLLEPEKIKSLGFNYFDVGRSF